ncbi:MAG: hypothetical protein EOO09_12125 [Chitinophagaceae bacterium]|nr:MAG: hypothetical protein EOO09_12125 [Chitinophagaceae bacterium]
MTKLTAIFFLTIHLFNLAGYQFAFDRSLSALEAATASRLDRGDYNHKDLVEVKIPLSMPYYNRHDEGYERLEGVVQAGGRTYDYVQRRIAGDTIYLLCLANDLKSELQKAKLEKTAEESGQPVQHKPIAKKQKADTFPPQPGILLQLRLFFADTRNRPDIVPALSTCVLTARPEPPRTMA